MKTKYLAFAAAAFMLASCSTDEDFTPQDNLKDTPITVTADVADLKTRAGHDADNLPAKFYLTVTQTEEASHYNYTNVEMTIGSGNNYTPSDNILWKDANRTPFVSAYTTADATFTVQADQSTAENVIASDLLGAVSTTDGDVTISGNNISVRFRHLLCKLDVTYSWGTEFGDVTKSIKSVVYNGFGTDAVLDRTTATITSGSSTDIITTFVGKTTVGEEEKDMSEAIFAPQMGENPKVVITTDIDGVDRVFSIGVTAPANGFASGNRYTMNVTIGGTSVENGSVTATLANGWETGDANGEADGTTGNMATN